MLHIISIPVLSEEIMQRAGTQTLRMYVARRQATVEEWVSTRTIFDVYA